MRHRSLGQTGLFVSELCLGTMTFGGTEGIWANIGGLQQAPAEKLIGQAIDAGINFLDTADVVVCLGASLMQTLAAAAIPAGRTIVHCTDDADDLNTEYRAAQAIVGDIKLVLRQLTAEAERRGGSAGESPVAEIRMLREAWLAQWMPLLTSDEIPINPYRIVWDLIRTIDPATSIVTHDAGSPRAQIAPFYPALAPRSYIGWGNSHQLGASLGLIMGAKLAAPEKLAVAYMGDAAREASAEGESNSGFRGSKCSDASGSFS